MTQGHVIRLASYVCGEWRVGEGEPHVSRDATTGEIVAEMRSCSLDCPAVLQYARDVGGPSLRASTFQQRASILKTLAKSLSERKQELYELSQTTGATHADCLLDVDGGLGTLFSYASRGARELPASNVYVEGASEPLSKTGAFIGQHICVPREGAAIHINAFNFPVWGLLEKFAPAFLAGVAVVAKPASLSAHVAEGLVRQIIDTKLLPDGSLQLICGSLGDLFDHLQGQDLVSFTGSADTAQLLRGHPTLLRNSVPFMAETDSLNASILAPDAAPGTPEFELFVAEVLREMTYKAGQRCTAIRRALVPIEHLDPSSAALRTAFSAVVMGDPRRPDTAMGPLASTAQRTDVLARIGQLRTEAELLTPDPSERPSGVAAESAFVRPTLLRIRDVSRSSVVNSLEAFGPVCTIIPYRNTSEAISIARAGQGSLVASVFTSDAAFARELTLGLAPYHGRVLIVDRSCAKEHTGHGSPMPGLKHGGPGRAGGGEELGGLRAVLHYLQRTAVQGSPAMLAPFTSA